MDLDIERFANKMDLDFERLVNIIFCCFICIESRLDELTLHFSSLHINYMFCVKFFVSNGWDTSMNGRNVTCEGELYFGDHDKSYCVLMMKCPSCMIIPLELILNLKR